MPLIAYNLDIPDAPNNPSNDQPKMKTNTNATEEIIDVDHYTFNDNDGGTHRQCTFTHKNVAGAQTDPQSTLYTKSGSASTKADLNFRNQNAEFICTLIRAAGVFKPEVDTTGFTNVKNMTGVSGTGTGPYTITLDTNVVTGSNIMVFINQSINGNSSAWTFTPPATLSITSVTNSSGNRISVVVLQV